MTARTKAQKKVKAFPDLCCGACYFCHYEAEPVDRYYCWGSPASFDVDGRSGIRKVPIIPEWPECFQFKPRMHG
jgi:hypothetical protein